VTEPTDAVAWCVRLGAVLTEVGDEIGALAGRVARDWPDAEGAQRAERLTLLQRSVLRTAEEMAELGVRLERAAAGLGPIGGLAVLLGRLAALSSARPADEPGVRLADVAGERVADGTGLRLPGTEPNRTAPDSTEPDGTEPDSTAPDG
jgi:hypothetical protein